MMRETFDERFTEKIRVAIHPIRLAILKELITGTRCVKEINELVNLPKPNLSQHLRLLRSAGWIDCTHQSQLRCYYILLPRTAKKLLEVMCIEEEPRQDEPPPRIIKKK